MIADSTAVRHWVEGLDDGEIVNLLIGHFHSETEEQIRSIREDIVNLECGHPLEEGRAPNHTIDHN